ncbi:type II secretion system protein [Methylosinus sp. Ce-a6]|uniref:type II secretion system protein n=1 Tax=Methylosinus sp. Ce-a6 TaxID=2172005 RepID=UPI001FCEB451|nr:type II secretion system protein [Methylosinus sp. Ce-a6]
MRSPLERSFLREARRVFRPVRSRTRPAPITARRGFALIEALAAFLILALVLGGLLQGVGLGARNESRGDFLLRAARQGRSQIEALGVETPLVAGETSGRYSDGLLWSLTIGACRTASDRAGLGETVACAVALTIRRPGDAAPGDRLTLQTVKIDASGTQR